MPIEFYWLYIKKGCNISIYINKIILKKQNIRRYNMNEITFNVEGMMCEGCEKRIEKASKII